MLEFVAFLICSALVAYLGVPWAYMRWLRARARSNCRRHGQILLTFDDGPSDAMTDRILDCLDRHDVHAVHFVMTKNAAGREDKIRRAVARGDVVGCHGHHHVHHWKSAPWAGIRDILAGWEQITKITGSPGSRVPFRPPYGKLNLFSLVFLLISRTPIAVWTIDSQDTRSQQRGRPEAIVDQMRSEGGGILLLHDYDRADEAVNGYVIGVIEALGKNPIDGIELARPDDGSFI